MEDPKQGGTEVTVKMHKNQTRENKDLDGEEASLEEEFIKIEKEVMSMKDNLLLETMSDEQLSFTKDINLIESVPISEWVEAQETIKELQMKLDVVTEELSTSESEKSKLKSQIEHVNEKLKERESQNHTLELDLRCLKEEASNAEIRHNVELQSLKEALDAQEIKYQELLDIREAFDMISIELEHSSARMKKLEADLLSSVEEAQKFEELSKQKVKHAEQESKKSNELEKMLSTMEASAKEMEDRMSSMQEELISLKVLVQENERIKEAYSSTQSEISAAQENSDISKPRSLVLEIGTSVEGGIRDELNREPSQSKSAAELEAKKVSEHAKMLEVEKVNVAEMEEKILNLQEEIHNLNTKVSEYQQIENALGSTRAELNSVKEELGMSKSWVKEIEQKSTTEGAIIEELKRELTLYKDSDKQAKKDILELQAHLTDLKVDYHAKSAILQEIEVKFNEESKEREIALEKQIQDLQEQLIKLNDAKESGESTSLERDALKNACDSLEKSLSLSVISLKEAESLSSQLLAEKLELEHQLNSLDELRKKELKEASVELNLIKEELNLSKSQVVEWEQKSLVSEADIENLKREIHLYKDSEEKIKRDMLELQTQLSDLKEEHHGKLIILQGMELKYNEELKARQASDISLKNLEKEILNLQDQLAESGKEKGALEALLVEHENKLELSRNSCNVLEEKLGESEEKLKEMGLILSRLSSDKQDLEGKLTSLVEVNKESSELAKSATQRSFDLEDLIKSLNASELELKAQMVESESKLALLEQRNTELEEQINVAEIKYSRKEDEAHELHRKVLEVEEKLETLKETHSRTNSDTLAELTLVKEKLAVSMEQAAEWENKSISERIIIENLNKEIGLYKDSEEKYKNEQSDFQMQLSDMKAELKLKLASLQDVELKHMEELKVREAMEVSLKNLENDALNLQEQLDGMGREKEYVEAVSVRYENNFKLARDACNVLEEKLGQSEKKLKETELVLSQILSEKQDLEQKLNSLEVENKESALVAKSATERIFELEDLVRSSNAVEIELKEQVKEAESKLDLLQQKNVKLEELLNLAEIKYNDKEYEVRQHQRSILEFEQKLGSLGESHNKELSDILAEHDLVKEELTATKDQVVAWEKKSISERAILEDLKKEIVLYKDSEEQFKNELSNLQIELSDLNGELNSKLACLHDIELKYSEEYKVREAVEVRLENLLELQDGIEKEKQSLEALLVERDSHLQLARDACSVLQEKLDHSEEKLKGANGDLSQAICEKQDLERALASLVQAHKESTELAKSATQRKFELEDLVKSSNAAESEVKAQMRDTESKLDLLRQRNVELEAQLNAAEMKYTDKKYEVENLQRKITESEKKLGSLDEAHNKALSAALTEIAVVKEQLALAKDQVVEWEKKSLSERAIFEEINKEIGLYKDSEEKSKVELLELQIQLSELKGELDVKLTTLQDMELKYIEECRVREAKDASIEMLEKHILGLQERLDAIGKEKESLESLFLERNNRLQLSLSTCNDLEEKLGGLEEELMRVKLDLSQATSEKQDLEQKLGSLVELYKESSELAKSATKRNFDLEDLVRASSVAELEVQEQMKEVVSKLEVSEKRNAELEELLNVAELKRSDGEYEIGVLERKILESEQKLQSLDEAHNKALRNTLAELTMVNEQLTESKNQVIEWEKKSITNGKIMEDLKREISLHKDFEEKSKKEQLEMQTQLFDLQLEHEAKATSLQDVELKYIEESKVREIMETSLKRREDEIRNLQEQLVRTGTAKESLEGLLIRRDDDLQQAKEAFHSLEEKLGQSENKLEEVSLALSQALTVNQDLEHRLSSLVESNKKSSELAKSATQRSFDLEDLVRSSNTAESEAKERIREMESELLALHQIKAELEERSKEAELRCTGREYEIEQLQKKVTEFEQKLDSLKEIHAKTLNASSAEISSLKEDLHVSKHQALEWEGKSVSDGAVIEALKREICVCKDFEVQAKRELLELQSQLTDLKEELNIKVISLQNVELKYSEEREAREATEVHVKSIEKEILTLREQLEEIGKERESMEKLSVERKNKLENVMASCSDLEKKLQLSDEKFKEMDLILSQSLSEKHDLEQKLGSLVELNKESGLLAKNATQRNFDLEDLVRSSNAAEVEAKTQMRETESKLQLLQNRNAELEEQLNATQEKCSDREYEIEQLQNKVLGFEETLSSIQEAHSKSLAELISVKDELNVSKGQVAEWQEKSESEVATIEGLKREVCLHMDSGEKAQKELRELQIQFSSLEKEHHVKLTSLLDFEHKYSQEIKAREALEVTLEGLEKELSNLQDQLEEVGKDKESLEALSLDLNNKLQQTTNTCSSLEEKLSLSEEKLKKADLLSSQVLSEKDELEQKLSSLDKLHRESSEVAKVATQRNLDLEDLCRSSNAVESELKAQLRETECQLAALHQKALKLEEDLSVSELKYTERENEVEQLHKKILELTSLVKDFEKDKELSRSQMHAYEDMMSQLESSLSISTKKNTEFEQQLKDVTDRCTYHENSASTSKQRSLELEDLISVAHSKSKDADSKVGELVLQLESAMQQLQVVEDLQRVGEIKYKDALKEVDQLHDSVTELSSELEAFKVKSTSLEIALQDAGEKEKELGDLLNAVSEEKKSLEMSFESTFEKLSATINARELLERELNLANERMQSVDKMLEDSMVREKGMTEELKSFQKQLDCERQAAGEAATKISELELQLESLSRDSESKLQAILGHLSVRESQIEELSKTLASSKEESSFYQGQVTEATQRVAALQEKVEEDFLMCMSLDNTLREVKAKLEDTESKHEQSLSENEVITATNHELREEIQKLQRKIDQLQELLRSANAEREANADQLACHVKSFAELTEKHSRGLELHSEMESHARETEAKLQEAVELLKVRDLEAGMLNERLLAIEIQARLNDERATEAANIAEERKTELEENQWKLIRLEEELERKLSQVEFEKEILSNANLKLTHELEFSTNEIQVLHERLDKLLLEKEETIGILHSSRATVEDLNQRLASEGERFQSKLSPIIEENNSLNKMLEETKKELMTVIAGLEDEIREEKAKGDLLMVQLANLKAELMVKSELQARIEELEQEVISLEIQHKNEMTHVGEEKEELWSKLEETACKLKEKEDIEEQLIQLRKEFHTAQTTMAKQRDLDFQKDLEREKSMKKAHEEFLDEHEQKLLLEKYVMDMEEKLKTAELRLKEKETEADKMLDVLTSEINLMDTKVAELEKKVVDLKNELQTANAIITKQDMDEDRKHSIFISELNDKERKNAELQNKVTDLQNELQMAYAKIAKQDMDRYNQDGVSTPELAARESKIEELENKVTDLQNELQMARSKIAKQEAEIREATSKAQEEIRSRDFVPVPTSLSRRKSRRSEGPSASALAHPGTAEPTLWESLKFVMGIAFFSVIIGIILGKRY